MKIHIDVTHPSDVHLFHHFVNIAVSNGNEVLITARNKEVTFALLDAYDLPHIKLGKHYRGIIKKILGLFEYDFLLYRVLKKFKPAVILSCGSIYAAHVGWLLRIPVITYEDTGNMEQIRLYLPFVKSVITPLKFSRFLGKKQIAIPTTKEIAYLLPKYYTPDPSIFDELGILPSTKYVVLRFVSWMASHDIGHKGIPYNNQLQIIEEISRYAHVFISSERPLSPELEKYMLKTKPHRMHDVLYYAQLLFGESATMASECAVLGTPAIFINNANIVYCIEQQKYDLVFNYREDIESIEEALDKACQILLDKDSKQKAAVNSRKYLEGKVDLTEYFLKNYVHKENTC